MTRHDDTARLRHMLDHAIEAVHMAKPHRRQDLNSDRQLNLALVRLVEIVGEAAARVSEQGRDRWPDIPWAGVIGLRNRLVHGYDNVDFDVLWQIVQIDLPPLISSLQRAIEEER